MKKNIILNGGVVEYDLQLKNVKRINLRVHRDGRVYVSANRYVPQEHIDDFLTKNADFILENMERCRRMREAGDGMSMGRDRSYEDGDTIYIDGEAWKVRVVAGKKEGIEAVGHVLLTVQKDPADGARRKRMMDKYLTQRCRAGIEAICLRVYPAFERLGVDWPQIRIRSMVSRWGSCQPRGNVLTFARQLVEVPETCREYVVMHEFAHFIHPDHSARFHNFMTEMMPDWKERQKLLNSRTWVYGNGENRVLPCRVPMLYRRQL
ncbi:MAG: SprT family zinc-dependent metalloprotease [Eubacteriales bacterium]|nr:SprT family zinc-dependent metalloprotease [Eubacteriales bacterium]